MIKRRDFLRQIGISYGGVMVAADTDLAQLTKRDLPIEVGSRKQLFIDNRFMERQTRVTLHVNPPRRAEEVLVPETPSESQRIGVGADIIRMNDEWWLYYNAIPLPEVSKSAKIYRGEVVGVCYRVCLATSKDGRTWRRKNVNLYNVDGTKENNVVIPDAYGHILVDPEESDGYRYWFLANLREDPAWKEADGLVYWSGLYLLKSKDGIHWIRHPRQVLPFYMDMANEWFYDSRIRKYVAYLRAWIPGRGRCVRRVAMDHFLPLPWPHRPLDEHRKRLMYHTLIDEIGQLVMGPISTDPPETDIYLPEVHQYELAEDVYAAFPVRYRHYDGFNSYGRDRRGKFKNDGVHDVALAVSRDGIHWARFPEAYMSLGLIDDVDGGDIFSVRELIHHGTELWQYCFTLANRVGFELQMKKQGALFRNVQRLDGFVSADADWRGGELTTPIIRFEGNRLKLNVDCGAMGETWVEFQDAHGKPITGFTMADSVSIDRNGVAQEAWWHKGPDVSALSAKPIRLHIKMRSAKLYAFQFTASN